MKIVEVAPQLPTSHLPNADFANAWRALDVDPQVDVEALSKRLRLKTPGWVKALLALRNVLVTPFGLKTEIAGEGSTAPMFPVISSQPGAVVMGLDDRHLDFRLVLELDKTQTPSLTATTYVRTRNLGGRLYLIAIKPFHRVIVRSMLRSALENTATA